MFLSYAHEDAAFVDRLYRDLAEAGVSATYDKVALEIGDSIIEKISGLIHGAACVVGVVSSASVRSQWVQRELSWALSGEVNGQGLKVLPAIIDQCDLPAMLADKLYADFRQQYFPALRSLLSGIRHSLATDESGECESESAPAQYDTYLSDCELLENAMAHADCDAVFSWLRTRSRVVAALVANPMDIVVVDPGLEGASSSRDTFVCWTMATQYMWHLVRLGPLTLTEADASVVWEQAIGLAGQAQLQQKHLVEFVRSCALADTSGELMPLAEKLDSLTSPSATDSRDIGLDETHTRFPWVDTDRLILMAGRREDHQRSLLKVRRDAKARLGIEVKSYEWLLETLGGKVYRRIGFAAR